MSQKAQILEALKRGESLTRRQIDQRFGCCKGPARISDLREEGYPIHTERLSWTGPHGTKKSCARWSLDKSGQLSFLGVV